MGSPPFQQHLSPLFCVLHCLGFCICAQKGSQNKKITARLRRKKKRKKDTGQPSLRLEFLVSSLSLSPLSSPLLWKKANPKRSSEEEEEEEEEEGVRRRRRLRRPFRFVERRRKSARERILFCVVRGVREDSNSNSGIKTISGDSHFSLAIISIERFGRVGTRSVRRETAVFFVCAL